MEGDFTLPDPRPDKLLFISAGSGITPIMSMLRALEQEGGMNDVVLVHSAHSKDDVIFGDFLEELDGRSDGFRLHLQITSEMGRLEPKDLEEICPDWREREAFHSGPTELLDAMEEWWESEGDSEKLHMERFQPKQGLGAAEEGEGGEIKFLKSDINHRGRRRHADPRRRRGVRPVPGLRLSRGHLPHLHGRAEVRQGSRPEKRERVRHGGRVHPRVHQRAGGPRRSRPLREKEHHLTTTQIESPLAKLSKEQIDQLGKEFDAIHDEVFGDLGDRDRAYITNMIEMHRRIVVFGRVMLLASRYKPAWIAGTTALSAAKILENMEIGHNVMHGQWDWMNDPKIHSSTWDWDTASTKEAWKHSHNYIHHTYTNIRGKDKDLGYEIMRIDPHQKWHPVYLLQPALQRAADAAVRVGRGRPRHGHRGRARGREAAEGRRQGPEGHRRQGAPPDPEGLHRLAGPERFGHDRARHRPELRRAGRKQEGRPVRSDQVTPGAREDE